MRAPNGVLSQTAPGLPSVIRYWPALFFDALRLALEDDLHRNAAGVAREIGVGMVSAPEKHPVRAELSVAFEVVNGSLLKRLRDDLTVGVPVADMSERAGRRFIDDESVERAFEQQRRGGETHVRHEVVGAGELFADPVDRFDFDLLRRAAGVEGARVIAEFDFGVFSDGRQRVEPLGCGGVRGCR